MSGEVVSVNFGTQFQELEDLANAIKDAIYQRAGQIPFASAIGVLEIVKHDLIQEQAD